MSLLKPAAALRDPEGFQLQREEKEDREEGRCSPERICAEGCTAGGRAKHLSNATVLNGDLD